MSRQGEGNERISAALREVATLLGSEEENPNPMHLHQAIGLLVRACGDDMIAALAVACKHLALTEKHRDQLIAAFKALKKQLTEKPMLAWILSSPFKYGSNGDGTRRIFVARNGRDLSAIDPVAMPEELVGDAAAPKLLSLCLISGDGSVYLGPVPVFPPLQTDEYRVEKVDDVNPYAGITQIVVSDGLSDRHPVLFATSELAATIAAKLEEGDPVGVQACGRIVTRIVKDAAAKQMADWLEFPPLEGPTIDDMVFPSWLHDAWHRDIRWILNDRDFRVVLIGPTGTGKSEGCLRARLAVWRAAREAKKPLAFLRLSAPHIASSW